MTNITAPQTFEEKMKARIKNSIGDLITDEQLSKLIEGAMHDTFLKPHVEKVPHGSWGTRDVTHPPFIERITKDLLTETVEAQVKAYIVDHEEEVMQQIRAIVQEGAGMAMVNALTKQMQGPMIQLEMNMQNIIGQLRAKGVVQ